MAGPSRLVLGAVSLGLVAIVLVGRAAFVEHGAAEPASASASSEESAGSWPDTSARERVSADASPGVLCVRVFCGGRPGTGTGALVMGPRPQDLHCSLAATLAPGASDRQDVLHFEFRGSFEVLVPSGYWSWVRVWDESGVAGFVRVPPFALRAERTVHLDPMAHVMHVQVYDSDFFAPAAGAKVRVLSHGLDADAGSPGHERLLTADGNGYLELRELAPGSYLLLAGDALPEDPPPYATRLVLPPPGGREVPCTLVLPPPRVEATVEVIASGLSSLSLPPRLFLRRLDDGSGAVFPVKAPMHDGFQVIELTLPPGTYVPDALPQGCVRVKAHDGRLDIVQGSANRFRFAVEAVPDRVTVRLDGPELQDYPLRVFVQPAEGACDQLAIQQFLGTFNWQMDRQVIPAIASMVRVCATGQSRSFLSDGHVRLSGQDEVAVRMVPATELIVHWFDWPSARDRQAMIHVAAAGEDQLVPMRPEVVSWHAAGRPALVGRAVVLRAAIHVECLGVDGMARWSRRITPEGPRTFVVVDSAR